MSPRNCARSFASRFDSGSSNRKTSGVLIIARAIAARCCWPPDIARGLRSRSASRLSTRATSRTRRSISAAGTFRRRSPNAMLSYTVMCGYSA